MGNIKLNGGFQGVAHVQASNYVTHSISLFIKQLEACKSVLKSVIYLHLFGLQTMEWSGYFSACTCAEL